MSESQATTFLTHWTPVDQLPNTTSGFSATVFQSKDNPDNFVIAIRGTEAISTWSGLNDWHENLSGVGTPAG